MVFTFEYLDFGQDPNSICDGNQWRIQDFPWGGLDLLGGGVWTPDVGTFWQKCIQK